MPKSADKSKTIRLKSSIVELIEQEANSRNLPFLDTVYYIILHYFMQNNQVRATPTPTQTPLVENTTIDNCSEENEEEEEEEEKTKEDVPNFASMEDFA